MGNYSSDIKDSQDSKTIPGTHYSARLLGCTFTKAKKGPLKMSSFPFFDGGFFWIVYSLSRAVYGAKREGRGIHE